MSRRKTMADDSDEGEEAAASSRPASKAAAGAAGSKAAAAPQAAPAAAGESTPTFSFKRENWRDFSRTNVPKAGTGRGGGWRALKQMLVADAAQGLPAGSATWAAIEAEPSTKPAGKYCDLTGLPGVYRDPQTRLVYAQSSLFAYVRALPPHMQSTYLDMRGAGYTIR